MATFLFYPQINWFFTAKKLKSTAVFFTRKKITILAIRNRSVRMDFFIRGHSWLFVVTRGHSCTFLRMTTNDYERPRMATNDYERPRMTTNDFLIRSHSWSFVVIRGRSLWFEVVRGHSWSFVNSFKKIRMAINQSIYS